MSQVVERKNASVDSCGAGWNCTFHVAFTAPGYKCTELASGVGSQPANLTQQSGVAVPPFGTDVLLPRGSYAYYAHATGGEYATTQLADLGLGGVPNTPPPYPPHMGAIRTEPVIWVGYVALADPDQEPPIDQSDPRWDSALRAQDVRLRALRGRLHGALRVRRWRPDSARDQPHLSGARRQHDVRPRRQRGRRHRRQRHGLARGQLRTARRRRRGPVPPRGRIPLAGLHAADLY